MWEQAINPSQEQQLRLKPSTRWQDHNYMRAVDAALACSVHGVTIQRVSTNGIQDCALRFSMTCYTMASFLVCFVRVRIEKKGSMPNASIMAYTVYLQ